jgi:LCP family protein required for cell wall assembly
VPQFIASPDTRPAGHRKLVFGFILLFAAASVYLSLVIVTRVERLFFPGNPITIPLGTSIGRFLPGIDTGDGAPQRRINLLIVGIDRRASDGAVLTRTDTTEIATIDPATKSATVVGVPRDLIVNIPGRRGGTYQDRINTCLVVAQTENYPEGPMGLMKEVIQNNFHITIDHYVIIDFDGFRKVIDALGGVDVDVPNEVYDPYYSESELPGDYNPQHFYPGVQHMDGETALAYSRVRFSSDDLDRIQRQQRVIFATIAKAESLNLLSNAPSLWQKYKDAIQTDISDFQVPGYALLAKQVEANLHAVSLGPDTTPYTTPQGADVLIGNWDAIQQLVNAVFTDVQPTPNADTTPVPVAVDVENGAGAAGLAGEVVDYLASKGYAAGDLTAANAYDQRTHTKSEIIDGDGTHRGNADLLSKWLGIPAASIRTATPAEKDAFARTGAALLVVLGTDQDFTKLQATAAPTPRG